MGNCENTVSETRLAIIAIIVEEIEQTEKLNKILHDYSKYIIGRMGIPYQKKNVNVISVAVDAPGDIIGAISGKLGMIKNITVKTVYSKL